MENQAVEASLKNIKKEDVEIGHYQGLHAFTGCDAVSAVSGKGKLKVCI